MLPQLDAVWKGGPARFAEVLSPFYDCDEERNVATEALLARMISRGECGLDFIIPVDNIDGKTLVRAPRSVLTSVPKRANARFFAFSTPENEERRRLHAKSILLGSDTWSAVMIGSSNFTAAGLGLLPSGGHLELNIAFGAEAKSPEAKQLEQLTRGCASEEELDIETVEWAPEAEEEQLGPAVLPWGFREALYQTGDPPHLLLRLDPSELPPTWRLKTPSGETLGDAASWLAAGAPAEWTIPLTPDLRLFFVETSWLEEGEWRHVGWPVNVTEPGRLPPVEELRNLSLRALLELLGSTRPLHLAVVEALEREERQSSAGVNADLDPLKRHSESGRLLRRTRQFSFALAGLRRRLERPASNLDTVVWRLTGPFGPSALAEALVREEQGSAQVPGETDFLLAELILTLSRIKWNVPTSELDRAQTLTREVSDRLRGLRTNSSLDPRLTAYVTKVFGQAAAL